MVLSSARVNNGEDFQEILLPEGIQFNCNEVWLHKVGDAVVLLPMVVGESFNEALNNYERYK